jgi:hypothetical protein
MVTEIHGLGDAEVADAPRWEEVAEEWRDFIESCVLHGYNAKRFDIPVLRCGGGVGMAGSAGDTRHVAASSTAGTPCRYDGDILSIPCGAMVLSSWHPQTTLAASGAIEQHSS